MFQFETGFCLTQVLLVKKYLKKMHVFTIKNSYFVHYTAILTFVFAFHNHVIHISLLGVILH
jgi:hypothetical protein